MHFSSFFIAWCHFLSFGRLFITSTFRNHVLPCFSFWQLTSTICYVRCLACRRREQQKGKQSQNQLTKRPSKHADVSQTYLKTCRGDNPTWAIFSSEQWTFCKVCSICMHLVLYFFDCSESQSRNICCRMWDLLPTAWSWLRMLLWRLDAAQI